MEEKKLKKPEELEELLVAGNDEEIQSFLNLLQRDELLDFLDEHPRFQDPRLLSNLHPSELAELLTVLPEKRWKKIVSALDSEQLSDLLSELEDPEVRKLLEQIQAKRLPELLADMESDDAADILGELPQEQVRKILNEMPEEEAAPLKKLLQYKEDTAGGLMQTELIKISASNNVAKAIEEIREQAAQEEDLDIYEVYVVDEKGRLEGLVSLDALILADPETPIVDLIEPELYWVHPSLDQEEVIGYFQRYDLVALPVIGKDRELLGRITVDDIVNVIEEEASEDILQMAGASGEDLVYDRILRSTLLRLPWLVTNLGGGLLTGYLMWLFKASLSETLALITFVPVITGMGGNVGTQSSSITVRGFALNRIDFSNFTRYFFKEMRVGALMGTICGVTLALVAWLWHGIPMLGLVVGLSLFIAMTLAASTGSLFPAIFEKLNIDPALASGPFVTTINDVMGIFIYLSTATFFRQWLIH